MTIYNRFEMKFSFDQYKTQSLSGVSITVNYIQPHMWDNVINKKYQAIENLIQGWPFFVSRNQFETTKT